MSENLVLWKILESKRDEVTGDWRQLHGKKLHDLYFSPNVIRVIKSKSEMYRACGNLMERDYLEDLGVDGRLILNCILKTSVGKAWTALNGSGQGHVAGFCERGNETLGSIKC
jgi:hypothetical protein